VLGAVKLSRDIFARTDFCSISSVPWALPRDGATSVRSLWSSSDCHFSICWGWPQRKKQWKAFLLMCFQRRYEASRAKI
jgi:hypothetical protein